MSRTTLTLMTAAEPMEVAVRPGTRFDVVLREAGLDGAAHHVGPERVAAAARVGAWPLLDGARVEPGPPPPTAALELRVIAGPGTGTRAPLGAQPVVVGRHEGCGLAVPDPALSREHVRVELVDGAAVVTDLGTTNGTTLDDIAITSAPWPVGSRLHAGDSLIELVAATVPMPPRATDGRVHHRPSASRTPQPESVLLERPAEPTDGASARTRWAVVLTPLLASAVLAAVMHSPLLLALGLTGPIVAVITAIGDHRHGRRSSASARREHAAAVARLDAAIAELRGAERRHREATAPTTARALADIQLRPARLWAGSTTWCPGRGPVIATTVRVRDEAPMPLDGLPIVLDLVPGQDVGIVGPDARAAARALVLQLAASLPPHALGLGIVADDRTREHEWGWAMHLPHRSRDLDSGKGSGPRLLVVDGAGSAETPEGCVVVRVGTPATNGPTLVTAPGGATLERPGEHPRSLRLDLVPLAVAEAAARALRPVRVDGPDGSGELPDRVSLRDLLPHDGTVDGVVAAWQENRRLGPVPLGMTSDGPLLVDLPVDGPHALVGGTTGAGKSELLTTLLLSLALTHSPDVVSVLLVDFKGGATASALDGLPHLCDVVTDLDPAGAERALIGLEAELKRRERLLAEAGATHVDDVPGLPRLLIVVDEFRVLAEEHPDFLRGLLRVATTGRSLGVHLVLATQRPAGIVSADVRANVALRIALRLNDAHDSRDVIEAPDAASLPPSLPGRAIVRLADGRLVPVQVAHAASPASATLPDVIVAGVPVVATGGGEPQAELVAMAVDAARRLGMRRAKSPVPPSLPSHVEGSSLVAATGGLPLGIVDLPHEQRLDTYAHDPLADGHLAVIGVARSGRTTALRQVVAATLAGRDPVHVHVIGDDALVAGFAGERLGSVIEPRHTRLVLRLLDTARAGGPMPTLVVIDGWQRVVAGVDPVTAMHLQDALVRLLAEGPGRGVHVAVSGDRSLLTGSLAGHLPSRLVLRLADATDLALVGLSPAMASAWSAPGRALRAGDGATVQVAMPPESLVSGSAPAPVRLRALPTSCPASPGVIGLGGDDARPVNMPRAATFAVIGPRRSGRTTALATATEALGTRAVRVGRGAAVDPTGANAVDELAAALGDGPVTIVIDDLADVVDSPLDAALVPLVDGHRVRVLVASAPGVLTGAYRGLAGLLRRNRCGVILGARVASDGEPLGIRLGVLDEPVPGRGVLVDGHEQTVIQVGLPVDTTGAAA